MDERKEFLLYLYKACDMGVNSTKELLNLLNNKENKIKVLVGEELKEYEDALEKVKDLLKCSSIEPNTSSIMANMSTKVAMHFEMIKDNSDTKIAEMLIQGYTMGKLELTKKIKKYKSYVNGEEMKLAEEIKNFHEKNIKKLNSYL